MNFQLFLSRLDKLAQVLRSPRLLKALICRRVFVGAEHRGIFPPGLATVVDIGANRGQFALAVRHWAPQARVISFEPLPEVAGRFEKLFNGDSAVTFNQAAIGAKAGTAILHVAAADDSSSLLPISTLQTTLFPGTEEINSAMVKVGRLTEFLAAEEIVFPALLKLDVQGFELEALRGCEDLLGRFSYVYAECSFVELYSGQALADEIIAWLRERGFRLDGVHNLSYDKQGRAIQGDFFFKNVSS
ncbi:MAG: FkbM family methyltransferase [Candidatus Riflebacteria bacterium]|nr:FkbM family methyltransferase [Candidatus Riflebacteria bacterium]